MRYAGHVTAVVVTAILGSAVFIVAPFFVFDSESDWAADLFLIGPALLGAAIAVVAAGRAPLLGIGAATFFGLGVLGLIAMGSGGRAEGGVLVVLWVVGTEVVGIYATAGIWFVVYRIKGRSRRSLGDAGFTEPPVGDTPPA